LPIPYTFEAGVWQATWSAEGKKIDYADYAPPAALDTFLEHRLASIHNPRVRFLDGIWWYTRPEWESLISLLAKIEHRAELNYLV
jgi:hypothetical protein